MAALRQSLGNLDGINQKAKAALANAQVTDLIKNLLQVSTDTFWGRILRLTCRTPFSIPVLVSAKRPPKQWAY